MTLKFSTAVISLQLSLFPNAWSQTTQNTVTKQSQLDQNESKKNWSVELGLERSSNFRSQNSADLEMATDAVLSPGIQLNDKMSLSARIGASHQETGAKETLVSDTGLLLSVRGHEFSDQIFLSYLFSSVAPTSKKSQEVDRLRTAAGAAARVNLNSSFARASYTLGLRKNFHEFVINSGFSPNIEYILSHRILLDIPIYKKISFASDLIYRNARTYRNFERQSFSFSCDLVASLTESFSVNVGVTNEGSATKANGKDSNLDLFNENTSVIRAGVSYVL